MAKSFEIDIKPLFAAYRQCMMGVQVGDDQGTEVLDLGDYGIVKRFHYQVQVAIHGYDIDPETGQPIAGAKPLLVAKGPGKGEYVVAPHPMPPGGVKRRLPQASIDTYDAWVEEGMQA